MGDQSFKLASEFPPATEEQWRKLVDGVLKGADFATLVSRTADALPIAPLYKGGRGTKAVGRRLSGAWEIVQRVDHPRADTANAQALDDLENGATGLSLTFSGAVGAYGFGLDASRETLARGLEGVVLDAGAPIELDLSWHTAQAADHLVTLLHQRGVTASSADIRFNLDPLGSLAANGASLVDWATHAPRFARMISEWAAQGFRGPFAAADGRVVHDAGGSEAQELAFVLAAALSYLRAFEGGGIALEQGRAMITFRLSADADQFLTMAKFRALRKLWARVEDACGLTPKPIFISAQTAWRMMTKRDAYTNMLRTTIATFAAGLGGADAITVLPHTIALGLPDAFARRIARNTQLILLEESNLARVTDPAAGSGGIEALTDQLCEAAWSLLQKIERLGGLAKALAQGGFQRNVSETRQAREDAIKNGKAPLVGTTVYPNKDETAPRILNEKPHTLPAMPASVTNVEPLRAMRLAEAFE